MRKAGFGRELGDRLVQLAPAQGVQEIAGEEDPLSLAAGQAFLDEMIRAPIHRIAHLGPETAAAGRSLTREKPPVDPRCTRCGHLLLDDEVRPRGERQALPALGIFGAPGYLHQRHTGGGYGGGARSR